MHFLICSLFILNILLSLICNCSTVNFIGAILIKN
nr:MAG TPA: hypothetical protein [Caudoviricetes sp.]